MQTVNQASLEDTSGRGYKHCLKFSVEEIIQKEVTLNCTAEVLYPPMGQDMAQEVNFIFEGETGENPDEEENIFYQRLKSVKETIEAQNIPDSFGNVRPEKKTTILLHDIASQEIIHWQTQVFCHPQYGTKVKHNKSHLTKEAQLE
ncbi:hypothetical protein FD754_014051 [Muntiacus muntjak]|uniref:Cystatin LXN-type domain-containing protein n=1 Tax=Muntiacus muntjak TaxID=9888 RepID=A0A5N3VJA1_MUNMU|nr:hypothetical protein FD754_014051 [Muntiacus muntjak]